MTGFNGKLKSKSELERYTKEQLMDMYFDMCENHKKFMQIIFTASEEQFQFLKRFYKLMNEFDNEEEE